MPRYPSTVTARNREFNTASSVASAAAMNSAVSCGGSRSLAGPRSVEKAIELLETQNAGDKIFGSDPDTGLTVYGKSGRFGPYVQLGNGEDGEKPPRSSVPRDKSADDVDLVIPEGDFIFLVGPSGAGKSTLMRLLSAVDLPDSGKIHTKGLLSWPVGLRGGMQKNLTGRDNVKFVCRIHGIRRADMQDKIRYVEDFADIGIYFDQPVSTYSSGMVARLAFGTSMAFDFDYYLIDEVIGAPILILPVANHDNNQHGKNENLRLQNLWDAIEIYAAILTNM